MPPRVAAGCRAATAPPPPSPPPLPHTASANSQVATHSPHDTDDEHLTQQLRRLPLLLPALGPSPEPTCNSTHNDIDQLTKQKQCQSDASRHPIMGPPPHPSMRVSLIPRDPIYTGAAQGCPRAPLLGAERAVAATPLPTLPPIHTPLRLPLKLQPTHLTTRTTNTSRSSCVACPCYCPPWAPLPSRPATQHTTIQTHPTNDNKIEIASGWLLWGEMRAQDAEPPTIKGP